MGRARNAKMLRAPNQMPALSPQDLALLFYIVLMREAGATRAQTNGEPVAAKSVAADN
jgi:hypothetical protein